MFYQSEEEAYIEREEDDDRAQSSEYISSVYAQLSMSRSNSSVTASVFDLDL